MGFFRGPGVILIDCDGTLISGQEHVLKCVHSVLNDTLPEKVSIEEVRRKFTPNVQEMYARFGISDEPGVITNLMERFAFYARESHFHVDLCHGIEDLLKHFKKEGHTLFVWTARDRDSTENLLSHFKIEDYFTDISCGSDGWLKPDIGGVQEMLIRYSDKNKIKGDHGLPDRGFVIGDSYTDLQGARALGFKGVAALWDKGISKNIASPQVESLRNFGPYGVAFTTIECKELVDDFFHGRL